MSIILDFDLDLRKESLLEHFIKVMDEPNDKTTWESKPEEDFHIGSSFEYEKSRKAGSITKYDDFDENGNPIEREISITTCLKKTYRVYVDNASFRRTTVTVYVRHYLHIQVDSRLYISSKSTEEQRGAIINEFDNADATNPDISGIVSTLQGRGIPSTMYMIVPFFQVQRTKIEKIDDNERRLIGLGKPSSGDGGHYNGTQIGNRDIRDWLRDNPLRLKLESEQHFPECNEDADDPLRVITKPEGTGNDQQDIEDAIGDIIDIISGEDECRYVKKAKEKVAVLATYPQFKIVWRRKKIKVGCAKITINVPRLYRRNVSEELFLILITDANVDNMILSVAKQCFVLAFAKAGVVGYITGNFQAALSAFTTAFNYCMEKRLTRLYECAIPELIVLKKFRKWRPALFSANVEEYSGSITINTSNSIDNIFISHLSFGPGICNVDTSSSSGNKITTNAPPATWSDWQKIDTHIGEATFTYTNKVNCDTGVRSRIKYSKK